MARRWTPLLCIGAVCCQPLLQVELPEVEGTNAVIVVLRSPDGAVEMYAGPGLTRYGPTPDDRYVLTALYYAESYDALQLAPGMLLPAKTDQPARPLPVPPLASRRTTLGEPSWTALDEIPDDVAILRIPAFDLEACADAGGCLDSPFADPEALRCTMPCDGAPQLTPPMEPDRPEPPMPPNLRPCARGFTPAVAEDLEVCDPPPRPSDTCPYGETAFYGRAACERIGAPCPTGWRADLPPDAILVDAGESISTAIASAMPEATIALAAGTFDESLEITTDLQIIGACPEQTRVRGTIDVRGGVVSLRDLTVSDTAHGVLASGGTAALFGVRVERTDIGIQVLEGGALDADRVLVRGTEQFAVWGAGSISIDTMRVDDCAQGCVTFDGAFGEVRDLAVTSTRADHGVFNRASRIDYDGVSVDGPVRVGFVLDRAATSSVTGLVARDIRGTSAAAVLVADPNSTLWLDDAYVSSVADPTNAGTGFGLNATEGAHLVLSRVRIEDVAGIGIHAGEDGARLEGHDLLLRNMSSGIHTTGVLITTNATAELDRVAVYDVDTAPANGFGMHGPDANVVLTDVRAERVTGYGLLQAENASVTLTRAHFEDCSTGGAVFMAVASLEDVRILDAGTQLAGACMSADGAALDIDRLMISGCARRAFVMVDTSADILDVIVTELSIGSDDDPAVAHGVHAAHEADGGTFRLERGLFESIPGSALFVRGFTPTYLKDIQIIDSAERGLRLDQSNGATLEAIDVQQAGRYGIVIRSCDGVAAGNINIEGTHQIGAEGGGLFVENASGTLGGFVSNGNAKQGVLLQERIGSLIPFKISNAEITGNDIGIQYPDTFDVRHLLQNVRLDNVSDELREDS